MIKKRFLSIIILTIIFISIITSSVFAIDIPERDINLKIENLTRGCIVYMLLPEDLFNYNMQKFVDNNLVNDFATEQRKAEKIKGYLDSKDYLGYIEYFKNEGYECADNAIEIRHYCICLGKSELQDSIEYNGKNYIKIKLNLNDNNEFKLIMKDYLTKYENRDVVFLIDEYGSETYFDLGSSEFKVNPENPNITECNVTYTFYSKEDYDSIEKTTQIAYLIIYIILIIITLIILISIIKNHKKKKEEIEARKFWKKKLTKEEIKEEKRKKKEEKKNKKKK